MQHDPKDDPLPPIGTAATFNKESQKRGWVLKLVQGPLLSGEGEGWQLRDVATDAIRGTFTTESEAVVWALKHVGAQ